MHVRVSKSVRHNMSRGTESDFFCEVCCRNCSGARFERSVSCHVCRKICCLSCCVENADYHDEEDKQYFCTPCYKHRPECLLCRRIIQEARSINVGPIAVNLFQSSPRVCLTCTKFIVQEGVREGKIGFTPRYVRLSLPGDI